MLGSVNFTQRNNKFLSQCAMLNGLTVWQCGSSLGEFDLSTFPIWFNRQTHWIGWAWVMILFDLFIRWHLYWTLPLDCLTHIIQTYLHSVDLLYPCKNSTISVSCLFMSSPSENLELKDHISASKLQVIPKLLIYKLYSLLKDLLVPVWRLSHQCENCWPRNVS